MDVIVLAFHFITIALVNNGIDAIDSRNYVFRTNIDRFVAYLKSEDIHIGKLDANGEFDCKYRFKYNGFISGVPPFVMLPTKDTHDYRVYEYRSGKLILGDMKTDGRFVPLSNAVVVDFDKYIYRKYSIPI